VPIVAAASEPFAYWGKIIILSGIKRKKEILIIAN